MPEPFEPLRETLLHAGVAPTHVRRYLRELSEHYADLVDEELEAGRSPEGAKAAARTRLGADETLAAAMLAEPSLRSWTGRAPWATLVIGPFLLLVLAWILGCVGVILLVGHPADASRLPPWLAWWPVEWLPRERAARLATALLDLVQAGGPLLIVSWVALHSARQRSRLIWPSLGCVIVALVGSSLFWTANWPAIDPRDPLHRVSWSLSMGFRGYGWNHVFSLADWSHGLPLLASSLAVAAAVYWMARGRASGTWATG
jgi:hypothetical protein